MKRTLALVVMMIMLLATPASGCWMYLSIEEMEEQAEIIVIGQLTGDIREVRRPDGTGVTFWSVSVQHLLRGEVGAVLEVATGGLVTKTTGVMLSTDYRLDSYGQLFLLYLNDDYDDGSYWPVTPRAIVPLEQREGGEIFSEYAIASEQHGEEERADILASIEGLPSLTLSEVVPVMPQEPQRGSVGLLLAAAGTASLAVIAVKRR